MADSVSKLYAEIGFKVNQEGIRQAKVMLDRFAEQLSYVAREFNKAADSFGAFSKKQNQQRYNQNRELEKYNKQEINEQIKQNREQERLYKQQLHIAEKAEREKERQRKEVIKNIRKFGKEVWNNANLIASGMMKMVGESVGRATDFSKLQMFTGISAKDFQSFAERAFATGSGMSQQDVMRDIQNVSANIQKIALGQGSLSGYKLMNVAARRGDVAGVIREFEAALQTISPDTAMEVGQQIGLSRDWIYSLLENRRGTGAKINLSQNEINDVKETGKAFGQVRYEVELFKDKITAVLSPALQSASDALRETLNAFAQHFENNRDFYAGKIKELAKAIDDFIKNLDPKDVDDFIVGIGKAAKELFDFARNVSWVGTFIKHLNPFAWYDTAHDWVMEKLKGSGTTIDTNNPNDALKHIMFDDETWKSGLKPNVGSNNGNVYSQANEINVTVESKSDNPHEVGEIVGNAVVGATTEKASFANNSTFIAGYNWG